MAKSLLVTRDIEAAQELLAELDRRDFKVTTAFWGYNEFAGRWYLYLASHLLKTEGRFHLYERIHEILMRLSSPLGFGVIQLLDPTKGPITEVTRSIGPVAPSMGVPQWRTSSSSTTSGVSTGDVLVYRST